VTRDRAEGYVGRAATELAAAVRDGRVSAVTLTRAHLDQLSAGRPWCRSSSEFVGRDGFSSRADRVVAGFDAGSGGLVP
jgi:hypothetical protein